MGLALGTAVIGMAVAAESPGQIDNPATANPAPQNRPVMGGAPSGLPRADRDNPGFREDHVLTGSLSLPHARYQTEDQTAHMPTE